MYYQIPEPIPIQLAQVATFSALDPWNGDVPAQWILSVYRMTGANNRELYSTYSAEKQRELTDGQNLDRDDVLGIRSSADGLYHILPVALVRLWQQGRVPNEELPELIATVEPRLVRKDFYDPVASQPWRRYLAYGIAVLGAVFVAGGVYSLMLDVQHAPSGMFGLGFWFGLGALYLVLAAVLLNRIKRQQQRVATQESEIAALLPSGAGPFHGRAA